jgi:succinylglutamic semialdehyde dehydrogenase
VNAADLVGGRWVALSGEGVVSRNPARPEEVVWSATPRVEHVDACVRAARRAWPEWSGWGLERRAAVLRRYAAIVKRREGEIATAIRDEVGKPAWDALAEAQLLAAKVDITLDPDGALRRVQGYELDLGAGRSGRCWFRSHGVMAVVGPFNFPAHLPNGHLVPALLLGNTAVFKPSDKAPAVGQLLAACFQDALDESGAPAGVMNLVHGGGEIAAGLVSHEGLDGVLFTGSWPVGRRILGANLDRPGRLLALEMGGNNAAVVLDDADVFQAVVECTRSAFVTAGQRCTCTRRVIVQRGIAEKFLKGVCRAARELVVGDPRGEVFVGPMISAEARAMVLGAQERFASAGGEVLVESAIPSECGEGWYLRPGVMRVARFERGEKGAGADVEVFGPLLRVSVAESFEDAVEQANATEFGLSASIFTGDEGAARRFFEVARAGCINWNTGTAGASSKLPFGGLGRSGNHRPAGAFSVDYCAMPVAGMVERGGASTMPPGMRVERRWWE